MLAADEPLWTPIARFGTLRRFVGQAPAGSNFVSPDRAGELALQADATRRWTGDDEMSKCLFRVSVVVLVVGQMAVSRAQVFNPPVVQPNVGVQQAGGPVVAAQAGTVEQTGWGLEMPKITMPKLTMPKMTMPSMDAVMSPFRSGFSKVTSGTRKAWEGTKEMFSFGKNNTATTSRRRSTGQQQPSFWQRLLIRESEPKIPQTVGEFMSQPRLDP